MEMTDDQTHTQMAALWKLRNFHAEGRGASTEQSNKMSLLMGKYNVMTYNPGVWIISPDDIVFIEDMHQVYVMEKDQ